MKYGGGFELCKNWKINLSRGHLAAQDFLKFLFLSSVRRENNDGRDLAYNFYILRYSRGSYIQLKSTKVRGAGFADKVWDAWDAEGSFEFILSAASFCPEASSVTYLCLP